MKEEKHFKLTCCEKKADGKSYDSDDGMKMLIVSDMNQITHSALVIH